MEINSITVMRQFLFKNTNIHKIDSEDLSYELYYDPESKDFGSILETKFEVGSSLNPYKGQPILHKNEKLEVFEFDILGKTYRMFVFSRNSIELIIDVVFVDKLNPILMSDVEPPTIALGRVVLFISGSRDELNLPLLRTYQYSDLEPDVLDDLLSHLNLDNFQIKMSTKFEIL